MNGDRGDFLSRWSRRKLELRQGQTEPVDVPDAGVGDVAAESPAAAEAEDALTPEEIAALPKVEELTPETDIRVFLKKGVPELLRNAALRRMWSLDPAIRDYVSEAREYAYDWNVPGGVPGNGPLLPSDNVEEMLGQIFGDRPRVPAAPVSAPTQPLPEASPVPIDAQNDVIAGASERPSDRGAVLHQDPILSSEAGSNDAALQAVRTEEDASPDQPGDAAVPSKAEVLAPAANSRRRHG